MDSEVKNFLYRNPGLYEEVYHGFDNARPKMFEQMFTKYLNHYPASILDIGSGTGRDIDFLAKSCPDCVGADYQEQMVNFAKSKYPGINFQQGDMRTLCLDRTFEAIICSGWALSNIHTIEDIDKTFETFAIHSQKETLLILVVMNAAAYLPGGNFKMTSEFEIPSGEYAGKATATFTFDRRQQLLIRKRVWDIPHLTQEEREDFVKFRLFFPMELEYYLKAHGFKIVGMFDNIELKESELLEGSLNIAAIFQGK